MALNAYLLLKGQKQGDIKGSVTQKGREGTILVIAASHEIMAPVGNAPGSGAAVGKIIHKPFVITKEVDKSSPLLYQAMVTNENITEWQLNFYAAGATGVEKNNYRVELINALITDIRFVMPDNKITELAKLNPYEEIEFVYQKITWTWLDPVITSGSNWTA